jgi:hypothetical protein
MLAAALPLTGTPANTAAAEEVIVTITRVRALDIIDGIWTNPDFMARVTIADKRFATEPIRNQADVRPTNWVFRHQVRGGRHPIKIEIQDWDSVRPDVIDISPTPNKRDLDFGINTGVCMVTGFKEPYRCNAVITRGGSERKKAEITFTVDVR